MVSEGFEGLLFGPAEGLTGVVRGADGFMGSANWGYVYLDWGQKIWVYQLPCS